MKRIVTYCIATVFTLIFLASTDSLAQGPPGGGGPGPCSTPPCIPPPPPGLAPIDGGVIFLLVSGLFLGVSRLRNKSK